MALRRAAAIDIGSNSIKVLVGERNALGGIDNLFSHTIEARISAGISRDRPQLADEGMNRGVAAIRELLDLSAPYLPAQVRLVATSAVRDAGNGDEFCRRVVAATGHHIRILSGREEADYIGRGVAADPALSGLRDFYLFDLGGGSLEALAFADQSLRQIHSLQLGCVRLTERFVAERSAPLSDDLVVQVIRHAGETLQAAGFAFDLPAPGLVVGTGGTLATVQAILARRSGVTAEQGDALLPVPALRSLLAEIGAMPLEQRRNVPGLSAARADVFPVALATLIGVAAHGGFEVYRHSFCNLRHGVVAEMLAP